MYQGRLLQATAVVTTLVVSLASTAKAAYPPPSAPSQEAAKQPQDQQTQPTTAGVNQVSYGQAPYAQAPFGQAPYGYGQAAYGQQVSQQQAPVQRPTAPPVQARVPQQARAPQQGYVPQQGYAPQQRYAPQQAAPQQAYAPQQGYAPYRVAQAAPGGQLPTPTEYVAPQAAAPATSASGADSYYSASPATSGNVTTNYSSGGYYPSAESYGSYGSGCNTCNGGGAAPSSAGCVTGNCGGNYGGYGDCNSCDYGCSTYMAPAPSCRQWFAGIYGLYMERDDSARITTSMTLDSNNIAGYPYYPPSGGPAITRVYGTDDVDFDFQAGAEIRFGSTFGSACGGCGTSCGGGCGGCGGCDTACGYGAGCGGYGGGCGYGAACCAPMPYAWEFAYWGIANDENSFTVVDSNIPDNTRMYTTIDYRGVEYDRDGAGVTYAYRPITDYVGNTPPIPAPVPATDPIPVAFQTRTNFSVQNMELNFLRLPLCGGGICGIGCGGDCGGDCCGGCAGGCDSCGCDSCGTCFQPSCSVTGVCGLRYMRVDDDFFLATQFASPAAPVDGPYDGFGVGATDTEFFHEISVDNHLTGFQLGANMDYCITPCWSFFCYSQFGLYNNHMKHYQRLFENGAGVLRFTGDGSAVSVSTDKNDIAFMGEMRLGGAYQLSCNCRLTAAWRAVAISGVALSTNHVNAFTNSSTLGLIDSQGSLIMHGLQIGSEFCF